MTQSTTVAAFERAFADYVGAKYAIALCNGTATLHTALVALGVQPGDRVAVPPLTMSATTLAVLQAGAVPVFCDVERDTWVMRRTGPADCRVQMPVDLYGLWQPNVNDWRDGATMLGKRGWVFDAAQTLRPHRCSGFTSYSFQSSKILALGEGGMLVTDDEALATRAREFSSLGYRMRADQPRIDPAALKSPTYARHHWPLAFNYRMNELTAERGLSLLERDRSGECEIDVLRDKRRCAAAFYRDAIAGCSWLTPQHVPEGWTHDYWTYAVAVDTPERWPVLADAIVRHGGERPYAAWRLTYQEPAFRHLAPDGTCPVAESLQPRLVQGQTNDLESAKRNAYAWHAAILEIGG